jgi:hypothetical protein
MKHYKLHWLGGDTSIVVGKNPADAMNRAGYGAGALGALDYYEEVAKQETPEGQKGGPS